MYTVNIGFCDQPPSGGSRSLNTGLVAIARLDIATRWPLNAEIKTYQLAHPVTPIGLREKMKVPKNVEQRKWGKKFLNLIFILFFD